MPALPPGFTYFEVSVGGVHTVARRSDGTVVAWGARAGLAVAVVALSLFALVRRRPVQRSSSGPVP